jgi:hypothetical protein
MAGCCSAVPVASQRRRRANLGDEVERPPTPVPGTVTFGEADGRFAVHGHLEGTLEPRI